MGIGHTYSWKGCMPHQPTSFDTETPESESETEVHEGEGQECNESLKSEDEDAICLEDRDELSSEPDKEDDRFDEDPTDDEAYMEGIDMYGI